MPYQANELVRNPRAIHQKRAVTTPRRRVQSTDVQAASTMLARGSDVGRASRVASPSGVEPMSSGRSRWSRLRRPRANTSRAMTRQAVRHRPPRQQDDGTDANARERQAHGKPTPAYEPVGQKERVRGIAERHAAATHEQAQREVEMPGGGDELGQEKPAAYHHGPKQHHSTWPMSVHQAAQERRRDRRHERPDREGTG